MHMRLTHMDNAGIAADCMKPHGSRLKSSAAPGRIRRERRLNYRKSLKESLGRLAALLTSGASGDMCGMRTIFAPGKSISQTQMHALQFLCPQALM